MTCSGAKASSLNYKFLVFYYGRITLWIDNFLQNRKIQVKVNGTLSDPRDLQNGVPQGCVISPILFNIAINDLPNNITGTKISQYADDIAIWKSHRNIKFLEKKIQQNLNDIKCWCGKWGFNISTSKTVAVLFFNKLNTNIKLNINNNNINLNKTAKFLGVTFDHKLTWRQHIETIITKCKTKLNILRCISGNEWGADCKTLFKLYTSLIKPILEYGCESFD